MATNFCSASSAAISPDSAPRHWWNLTVGVPQAAKVPADWLPARPNARAMVSASKRRSRPTAAAVGWLRRFDAETMARAFGLAGSQSAGTFAAWGTPTVKFHQCRGALSGLMAALLAEQKFVATREFLTAPDGGLYNAYANGGKPEAATADLGKRWELEREIDNRMQKQHRYPDSPDGPVRANQGRGCQDE